MTTRSNSSGGGLEGRTNDGSSPKEVWRCIAGCGSCCRLGASHLDIRFAGIAATISFLSCCGQIFSYLSRREGHGEGDRRAAFKQLRLRQPS
jgi:hypothetical protein